MARKVRPISELSDEEKAERRLARKLKFDDESSFRRWKTRLRNLPESDIRYLRPGIEDDDFEQLNRLRQIDRRYRTPAQEVMRKFNVLVVHNDASVHMSAFAFEDRYREALQALLHDPALSAYRKRQLRKMQRELQSRMRGGDIMPGIIPKGKQPKQPTLF